MIVLINMHAKCLCLSFSQHSRILLGECAIIFDILKKNFFRHYCEAQGKGRAKGRPRKVTERSFIDYRWWMVDGGYPFPDALH